MNKRGFTLVELVGVITFISLLSVIVITPIVNQINKKKASMKEAMTATIKAASDLYIANNKKEFKNQTKSCIKISDLVVNDYLDESVFSYKEYNVNMKEAYVAITDEIEITRDCNSSYNVYDNGTAIYFDPQTGYLCDKENASSNYNIKEGCMKWYIFNDSSSLDTVNLLLDHNTTATVAWNSSGNKIDGMKEVKIALENDTKDWKTIARLITADEIAMITGAKEILKWNSDKPYSQTPVIGNSISWYYLDGRYGTDSIWNTQVANETTKSKFAWLFDYTSDCITYGCNTSDQSNSGYWTSTPVSDDGNYAWSVAKNGYVFYYGDVDNNTDFGVRPVITIPKYLLVG